jgi:hypothetical protein
MSNTIKKKRGRPSKKETIQIHGKDETVKATNMPSSLDDILKENLSLYSAKSTEEYQGQLAELNMSDLQAHAYKVGLVPTSDRKILTDRLVHEFMKWNSRFGSNVTATNSTPEDELPNKVKKILREGA